MAYDENVDAYLQSLISQWDPVQMKMFGGTGYLINGNMLCGVIKKTVILRVGKDAAEDLLSRPAVTPFDMTGRPLGGWEQVDPEKTDTSTLKRWIAVAYSFVAAMPAKEGGKPRGA